MKNLRKHRKIVAFSGVMILLLIFTYFFTGNNSPEKSREKDIPYEEVIEKSQERKIVPEEDGVVSEEDSVTTASETETEEIVFQQTEVGDIESPEEILTCTIAIRCDTILNNMDSLDEAKHPLIPSDGIILSKREVTFNEGENVFDVLLRETGNNGIHMEFVKSPAYDSAYIEGIHNIYEFDCGELSGWMYNVNGWFPNYGCSSYVLSDGDIIEWVYTCDLGNDVKLQ